MTAAWAGKSVRFYSGLLAKFTEFSREEQMNRVKQCTSAACFSWFYHGRPLRIRIASSACKASRWSGWSAERL